MSKSALEELHTERLRLRRYRKDDFESAFRLTNDPRVMRYYPAPFDRDRVTRMLENVLRSYDERGYSVLVVERATDGAYLGQIGLLHWDDVDGREDVEVAYMLVPEAWGAGYATEAARACRDWAFEQLGADRVVSFISVENEPSMRVAERNGMTRLKRLNENRLGIPIYVYAIARDDWESTRTT
ncbi:MAG TPA: GNAT family N-acetyltransferase [Candidatus Baltobacteraceae bacterium]|nr:GNAT family N-acetyltransferase [Candidatus Baltobacteraceae bacterium]